MPAISIIESTKRVTSSSLGPWQLFRNVRIGYSDSRNRTVDGRPGFAVRREYTEHAQYAGSCPDTPILPEGPSPPTSQRRRNVLQTDKRTVCAAGGDLYSIVSGWYVGIVDPPRPPIGLPGGASRTNPDEPEPLGTFQILSRFVRESIRNSLEQGS